MSQTPEPDPVTDQPQVGTQPLGEPIGDPTPIPSTSSPARTTTRSKRDDPLRASRTSGFYTAVIALGVVLVLLIIFIVQNTGKADVHYFGFDGRAPQAVLLLIALAAGIFLTATASTLRLLQVRHRVKKERKARH